jgi:hypothetical protein
MVVMIKPIKAFSKQQHRQQHHKQHKRHANNKYSHVIILHYIVPKGDQSIAAEMTSQDIHQLHELIMLLQVIFFH